MKTKAKKPSSDSCSKRMVGIVADAQKLGVSRFHLHKVLTGQRESSPLLARYRALQAAKSARVPEDFKK